MLHLTATEPERLRSFHQDAPARSHQLPRVNANDTSDGHSSVSTSIALGAKCGFPQDYDPAQIPVAAALLAWRLLIARSGEEDNVDSITVGRSAKEGQGLPCYNPTTQAKASTDFEIQFPKFCLPPDARLEQAYDEASRALDRMSEERLGAPSTLYLANGTREDGLLPRDKNGDAAQPHSSLVAEPRRLGVKLQWRTPNLTESLAKKGLDAFTDYLGAIFSSKPSAFLSKTPRTVWDLIGPSATDLSQIWSWNATLPPTINRCIHDLVSERALANPDKIAVSAWDGDFTYREVEHLSNTLARQLRSSAGVRVGDIVMLVFEKSRWTTPALLGVLKSGAAFVLTDPAQPEARLKVIASQTRARAVVCSQQQSELATRIAQEANSGLETIPPAKVLVASDTALLEHAGWGFGTGCGFLPVVPPSSPMYIIFTSGSTGVPKGVICSHANFVSGAIPRADAVGYRESSRVFEFASYAFDVSIDCMLCTLMQGGTICVPSEAGRVDNLGAAILTSGANMAHMTPSVARVLEDPERVMRSLDVLGLGGEAVSAGDAAAWSKLTKIIIAYGPSECTVGCTINHEVCAENTTIGKGTGGLTWIVDPEDHNRLMPVGSVGELLIEGPVVGLGYLGQPDKTAEVFINDPTWLTVGHGDLQGRRGMLYKTGDLVKYDSNGYIVFVGRKDQQVKLRGQRIELSEIEHHLRAKLPPCVKIAAEVIRPSGAEPTLVVFATEPAQQLGTKANGLAVKKDVSSDSEIFKFTPELAAILANMDSLLGEEIPRYMVPAAYIPLREMPTLPSAKIDRKKLRALGNSMTREQIGKLRLVAPKPSRPLSDSERQLAGLWKRILNTDVDISLQDSFFGVGGDSLRAMKLVSAARAEGIVLSVADVFNNHTLMGMAAVAVIDRDSSQSQTHNVAPFSLLEKGWALEDARTQAAHYCGISPSDIEDIYPCTPLQEGLMALSAKFQDSYVAQRVLQLPDASTAKKLQDAFETAARDCAILRTRIIQVPGRGLQQVVVNEAINWRSGTSVEQYLETDREEEMDLGKPLVRYGLVPSDNGVGFVLTMHHALYDGWSMPLVIERINRAYDGLPTERPAEFKHFIRFLTEVDKQACEAYWRDQLQGATGIQFPALPHEGYITQADSLLEISIPAPPRGSNSATTTATIVRGAWALVASVYAGHNDIVFGETLTGRNAPVMGADLIEGPMITTVPIRVGIDKQTTVVDFLKRIQDQTVRQIPYEHTGLQHIRRLSPDAMEACELRTGLVLHPAGTEEAFLDDKYPANSLVPANDSEAAKEALKFNTYALMLVCSLGADGYFVMASFDSNTVDKATMERVLEKLKSVTKALCEGLADGEKQIGDVLESAVFSDVTDNDLEELAQLGQESKATLEMGTVPENVWLVHPDNTHVLVPRGAVGEIIVESLTALDLPSVEVPDWHKKAMTAGVERPVHLHTTGQLAKYDGQGRLVKMGAKGERSAAPRPTTEQVKPKLNDLTNGHVALSPKETKLRVLWSQILNLDATGIEADDSFFRLGGDSIAAMKLVSEARPAGLKLTVAQIFKNKTLSAMAEAAEELDVPPPSADSNGAAITDASNAPAPFTSLDNIPDVADFVEHQIRHRLSNKSWKIDDVYPARPLQAVAVTGSTQIPRFSMRYEAMYFDDHRGLDMARLIESCQELVKRNEILRTVFATAADDVCYGVVIEDLISEFEEHIIADFDGDVQSFTHDVCNRDIEGDIPEGSAFIKWFFIQKSQDPSDPTAPAPAALVMRISHAQYDEICLPLLLRQLVALYSGNEPVTTLPFSSFVNHTVRVANPASVEYWTDLLAGSAPPTVLRPDLGPMAAVPASGRAHFAVDRTIEISIAPKGITVATIPTAAWALCLARRRGLSDVVFGEVVSGRGTGFSAAEKVVGPCWQYVPVRVRFEGEVTGTALLDAVQEQHAASSAHEGLGLGEIAQLCCPSWPADEAEWFDTVVHQDVEHVEDLGFGEGVGLGARTETIYPHQEPLREWKVQAFVADGGRRLTMEIVTFEAWREHAVELLDELMGCVEELVVKPEEVLRLV